MKTALITGVTGQDGSYLAEFLLEKGYDVHGVVRRSATEKRERIDHLEGHPRFHLHYGDLADSMSLFEEGTALIKGCGAMLDEAEQKVVMLKKGADGEPVELPFDVE